LTSNDIADLRQSFLFVSGVSDNADELRQNINLYKVATSPDKDASMLSVVIPLESEAREKKLDRLKQDIYSMSSSVDFYDESFRNAISGEAIKKLMYPLDLKVNRFLRQVSSFLRDAMYFIVTDINRLYGKSYKVKDLEWIFKTNQIINTTETINNIIMLYSSNLIDLQEALDLLPLDINKEELLKRLESQNTLPEIEEEDDSNTAE
jgi:SPP1 family phage portal protein